MYNMTIEIASSSLEPFILLIPIVFFGLGSFAFICSMPRKDSDLLIGIIMGILTGFFIYLMLNWIFKWVVLT